jgi:hypothetical protein
MKPRISWFARLMGIVAIGLAALVTSGPSASAAQAVDLRPPSWSVPMATNSVQASALVDGTCNGAGGALNCQVFMKIERSSWRGWQYAGGRWITGDVYGKTQWATVWGNRPAGCYDYKTTVETYTDAPGSYGSGVNIGEVGTSSNGMKMYRWKISWSSGSVYMCA